MQNFSISFAKRLSQLCLFLLIATFQSFGIESQEIPKINETAEISFMTPNGWSARFRDDGSAYLEFGSLPAHMAKAPKGSFSMSEIYESVVPFLVPLDYGKDAVSVCFQSKTSFQPITVSVKNKAVIKKVYKTLIQKVVPVSSVHFEEARKNKPLPCDEELGNEKK